MRVLLKCVAVLFVAIAAFLVYAVIHAFASAGGARVGICILYVAGAAVLSFLAVRLWRWRRSPTSQAAA
jgi:threonine/homoserine/homoserine lactone efflux protein